MLLPPGLGGGDSWGATVADNVDECKKLGVRRSVLCAPTSSPNSPQCSTTTAPRRTSPRRAGPARPFRSGTRRPLCRNRQTFRRRRARPAHPEPRPGSRAYPMIDFEHVRAHYFDPPAADPVRIPSDEELIARYERRRYERCTLRLGDPAAERLGPRGSMIGGSWQTRDHPTTAAPNTPPRPTPCRSPGGTNPAPRAPNPPAWLAARPPIPTSPRSVPHPSRRRPEPAGRRPPGCSSPEPGARLSQSSGSGPTSTALRNVVLVDFSLARLIHEPSDTGVT